jgi:transcriptional regulator CBF1
VPNGSGEKAKGAILSRAVQYIHHLKENEARNIEKWTLEKLLMDQAMGDLQQQLDEVRRLWEEERTARQRAESDLGMLGGKTSHVRSRSSADGHSDHEEEEEEEVRGGKRQRVE